MEELGFGKQLLQKRPLHVVGVGHALTDSIFAVETEFLDAHGLKKDEMSLCDAKRMAQLRAVLPDALEHAAGGSVANSVVLASKLGLRCAFIGKVADDKEGALFRESLQQAKVIDELVVSRLEGQEGTGCCFIFVTPDKERTFATHLGVSAGLRREHIDASAIESAQILYLEGYLYNAELEVFEEAAAIARKSHTAVALSLSDRTCVQQSRQGFLRFLAEHAQILFTNDAEAQALFSLQDLSGAALHSRLEQEFAAFDALICLTLGAEGALLLYRGKRVPVAAYHPCYLLDTAGAGDAFAAGMLYGLARGWSLEESGALASELGARVVEEIGPRVTREHVLFAVMQKVIARNKGAAV